jgi:hypothetical protein
VADATKCTDDGFWLLGVGEVTVTPAKATPPRTKSRYAMRKIFKKRLPRMRALLLAEMNTAVPQPSSD